MAVATISKKSNGFHVTVCILGHEHLLHVCPKITAAVEVKRAVDSGKYKLPHLNNVYVRSEATKTRVKRNISHKPEILEWLENHQKMWTTEEIAKKLRRDSRPTSGAIRSLLIEEKICRGATSRNYVYGALGIMPETENFGECIIHTLTKHPEGLAQRLLFEKTGVNIPFTAKETLRALIEKGLVKTRNARRLHTMSRSVGLVYCIGGKDD